MILKTKERKTMIRRIIKTWLKEDKAFAATEFAMIFPILFSLLMGTYDIGQAMIINQKVMSASQITADLIARSPIASAQDVNDAIEAGRLAMSPYDTSNLDYEIKSVRFDSEGEMVTEGEASSSSYTGSTDLTGQMDTLANPGEGVLGVVMQYKYIPFFFAFFISEFNMEEVAYARGRKSSVVYFE
jgi:Flp pilus assembly protein TadG